jgi:HAE1 family hydrophobic/amphiphilic exporter-1
MLDDMSINVARIVRRARGLPPKGSDAVIEPA